MFANDVVTEGGKVVRLILDAGPNIGGGLLEINEGIIGDLMPHHFRGAKYMYLTLLGDLQHFVRNNSDICTPDYLIVSNLELIINTYSKIWMR